MCISLVCTVYCYCIQWTVQKYIILRILKLVPILITGSITSSSSTVSYPCVHTAILVSTPLSLCPHRYPCVHTAIPVSTSLSLCPHRYPCVHTVSFRIKSVLIKTLSVWSSDALPVRTHHVDSPFLLTFTLTKKPSMSFGRRWTASCSAYS
jgi:hypothetical protein